MRTFVKTETKTTVELADNLLYLKAKGIEARAYEDPSGFVALKGSQAVRTEVPSVGPKCSTFRKDLLEQGVLSDDRGHYVFVQDQTVSQECMTGR